MQEFDDLPIPITIEPWAAEQAAKSDANGKAMKRDAHTKKSLKFKLVTTKLTEHDARHTLIAHYLGTNQLGV